MFDGTYVVHRDARRTLQDLAAGLYQMAADYREMGWPSALVCAREWQEKAAGLAHAARLLGHVETLF